MNHRRLLALALALVTGAAPALAADPHARAKDGGAPAAQDRTAVAEVDGTPITVGDLNEAIADMHGGRTEETTTKASSRNVGPIIDRLVTLRLFVSEARDMGLDAQPAFTKAVADYKEQQLRRFAELRATRGVRPDAMEVERITREATREWKVRSLLFEKKDEAVAFRAAIAQGKPFADAAREALAKKQATGNEGADWMARGQLLPQVAEAVARVEQAPATTDPIAVKGGFAVASVEAIRYRDDPRAKAMAEAQSVERLRTARLEQYRGDLERKYARTDQKLWKRLDFEAKKPGFAALAKDRRAVVTIRGGTPVTVADVAAEMQRYFFHGVDEPIKEKKLNEAKTPVLHKILTRRLFLHAAAEGRIAASPEYRKAISDYEDSLLFGAYVEKVVVPDVKVTEQEGKDYYAQHRAEFTFPAFYKLEGLAFSSKAAAEAAQKKLRAGTDFAFLRANADGQVKPDDRALALDGQTFSANALPPDLVQALAGARRDDVRAYATGGQHYVVRVLEVTPPKEQPYAEARAEIGKKLAADNLNKALKDVAAKLRASHKVAVHLERIAN